MELPDKIRKATSLNPRTILFYTKPKEGKTTLLSGLDGLLITDTEDGSVFIDALVVNIKNFDELRDLASSLYEKGYNPTTKVYTPPYKYIAIDTLTRIDEWSEIVGTFAYMEKPQGKKFNRVGGNPLGQKLDQYHPEFETVHEIGQGYGYKYSREAVLKFFDSFNTLAPHIIYVCHVKDKFIGVSANGAEISTKEINLTGKLKDIIASKVDIIAHGVRDKNQLILSFSGDNGSRSPHLSGKKIVASESNTITKEEYETAKKKTSGEFKRFRVDNIQYEAIQLSATEWLYQKIEFHWDKIFLKSF